jgi:hypothetical protein
MTEAETVSRASNLARHIMAAAVPEHPPEIIMGALAMALSHALAMWVAPENFALCSADIGRIISEGAHHNYKLAVEGMQCEGNA